MARILTVAAAQTGSVDVCDLRTITEAPGWRDRRPDLHGPLVGSE